MPVDAVMGPPTAGDGREHIAEFARFLLLTDRALDREILKRAQLHSDEFNLELLALAQVTRSTPNDWRSFLKTTRAGQSKVTETTSDYAQMLGPMRHRFCKALDYCRKKSQITFFLNEVRRFATDELRVPEEALSILSDIDPEWITFLSGVLDIAQGVPIWFLARLIKRALDLTCPCCVACKGSGVSARSECPICHGTGSALPDL
jgi:hypothetical protein